MNVSEQERKKNSLFELGIYWLEVHSLPSPFLLFVPLFPRRLTELKNVSLNVIDPQISVAEAGLKREQLFL